MFGVSSRGQTRRESERCGAPFNAAPTAVGSTVLSAAAWPCAHAQLSFKSGSSRKGLAGAAILSCGSGASGTLMSCTPSCCRTTTRHSHGRSWPLVLARAGVNSHGKSARSNSIDGKQFGSKSLVFGRGSVRTTW